MTQRTNIAAEPSDPQGEWKGTARYEVVGRLGEGGMGVVYEALDRERGQRVALKTLQRFTPAALYLFKREFRTLADVHHTNLVRLHEMVVADGGDAFFTMELVRGRDFLAHVRKSDARAGVDAPSNRTQAVPSARNRDTQKSANSGRGSTPISAQRPTVDEGRLRDALRQLVEGVHALHIAGKLHRDIKPSNVLVTHEGRVVLLDFGVATDMGALDALVGGSGEIVGTAVYMAPEQADDQPPAPASDWYSVGVMLYEAFVGRPPFMGSAVDVITMKGLMDPPPLSESVDGVPPDIGALCSMLLCRDPAARPTGPEILRRLGAPHSSPPASADGPAATPFVGREEQVSILRDAFATSRQGRSVTVLVAGASGMGKSTLVNALLDEFARDHQAVVLRGRAYEREAVPYKAVDSAIDALSRHLVALEESGEPVRVPEDAWTLGRLFPVLQRVRSIAAPAEPSADDVRGLRVRAFTALRRLLGALAERRPLVVFVDDAHWGDVDSARLLLDLVRPPAPPLLLVMTCRDDAPDSPFLAELRDRWPAGAEIRRMSVGPLGLLYALRLALSLLDEQSERAERVARAVARESQGSPFLIEELARANRDRARGSDEDTLAAVTLEQVVHGRLERLPGPGRTVVELISVGAQPLPVDVVAAAMGVSGPIDMLVTQVVAQRFARVGLHEGREVIEVIHDRIRDMVVGEISAEMMREHHARLARALESSPDCDGEAIAMHWLGAGDHPRTARAAQAAAEQAVVKLAFDQAARLFRMALELGAPNRTDARRLQLRLAQALDYAGRGPECARIYLEIAKDAEPTEQIDYRRAAAEQLLTVGRIEEGAAILHDVLAAVGIRAPRSPLSALFFLLVYRTWQFFLPARFEERRSDDVSQEDRVRVDALWAVSLGFGTINMILAACMQARHLVEALRKGDRSQLLRAAVLETAYLAGRGKRPSRREIAFGDVGTRLSELEGTARARAHYETARGAALFYRGYWRQAQEALRKAETTKAYASITMQRRLILERTCYYMGEVKESERQVALLMAIAQDRGDLHTLVGLRTSSEIDRLLVADEPEKARRELREAQAEWPQKEFLVQHWQAMVNEPSIDLYLADPGAAYDRFARALPALRRSLMLRSGYVRAVTYATQGRLAIASIAATSELRRRRIAEARVAMRELRREYPPWTAVLASNIEALVANAEGDRATALAALRRVIDLSIATDSLVFVPPAEYRLGELLGGEEGKERIQAATRKLEQWGVKRPGRWVDVSLPGRWTDEATAGRKS
jgi:eukaryotic-like serine/threonine-protein kinase